MPKRTRLSICRRKVSYPTAEAATAAALASGWMLRPYRCDRCSGHHLTSRRKGHHTPAVVRAVLVAPLLPSPASSGSDPIVL